MMNAKEALNNVKKCACDNCTCESFKELDKLVLKATERAPKEQNLGSGMFMYKCHNCHSYIPLNAPYCIDCGQKLKWE